MFELTVQREFCAAHAIMFRGTREPTHGHNWKVTVVVRGDRLDADGLLCDFHLLERELDRVIGRFNNNDLNAMAPFDRLNPTAEQVAKHIADAVASAMPKNVNLNYVSVTEAPGCVARYYAGGAES